MPPRSAPVIIRCRWPRPSRKSRPRVRFLWIAGEGVVLRRVDAAFAQLACWSVGVRFPVPADGAGVVGRARPGRLFVKNRHTRRVNGRRESRAHTRLVGSQAALDTPGTGGRRDPVGLAATCPGRRLPLVLSLSSATRHQGNTAMTRCLRGVNATGQANHISEGGCPARLAARRAACPVTGCLRSPVRSWVTSFAVSAPALFRPESTSRPVRWIPD